MCVYTCILVQCDRLLFQMSAGMSRPKCYHTMDAFVKLVVVLVRYSGEPTNTLAKVNLLNKVNICCYTYIYNMPDHTHVHYYYNVRGVW